MDFTRQQFGGISDEKPYRAATRASNRTRKPTEQERNAANKRKFLNKNRQDIIDRGLLYLYPELGPEGNWSV